jgi:hypothetical protein
MSIVEAVAEHQPVHEAERSKRVQADNDLLVCTTDVEGSIRVYGEVEV